ncbi:hypothetical protein BST33_01935 [Mycolicibacter minnesotensis]|uniref:Uncharacterized protein n=1 Tax=Mycolicibacter minnesotensis TaxID=1118379 RepID=A0A7I7R755_9MYCO|nr:hypothetical protein [Mycolicibacter minnesotensis]ORB03725.1 hypothetical protein BST33_01935 [Mycolicibacter minnesotensis]BBY33986.1 hypothetical protein MMIN_20470 [Mycolicibacter minnesotensis]
MTVGNWGTLGTGGMVTTEGNEGRCGRWRWGGSLGAGACWTGGCWGGACRGGAADGAVVLGALDEALVELLLVLVVVLVALDELVPGAVLPPPGPRLVSWMIPQTTSASMTAMSPNQATSTDRRRNQGMAGVAAKSEAAGVGGSSKGL